MGIETAIMAALMAVKTYGTIKQGKEQAKEFVRKGEFETKQKAKEIRMRAAAAKTSFLSSGLSLEGTPAMSLSSMFSVGMEDIQQIMTNANISAKGAISAARTKAISDIASIGMSMYAAGSFSGAGTTAASYMPEEALFKANEMGFGNLSYEALEMKDLRGG